MAEVVGSSPIGSTISMRTKIILKLLVIISISGCGGGSGNDSSQNPVNQMPPSGINPNQKGTLDGYLQHNGIRREFILYVPQSYNQSNPTAVIFNFHGFGSNAFEQMNYGDFRDLADENAFIIAHPQGTTTYGNGPHWNNWNGDGGTSNQDDIGFIDALISLLQTLYNIDDQRVYSTGMSNGGFFSYHLACNLGARIAAVASVTGTMSPQTYSSCTPTRPISVMQMHGLQDSVVPFLGFPSLGLSQTDLMEFWAAHNNCSSQPDISLVDDLAPNDGSTGIKTSFLNCDKGTSVEFFLFDGAGHTWPGTGNKAGSNSVNMDIDGVSEIYNFFNKNVLNP